MSSNETITFDLEVNTTGATRGIRRLQTLFIHTLSLYNRICRLLGVPEDSPINKAIARVQQFTLVIRQFTAASVLLQTASGPIGWATAGLSVAGAVVSSVEFMQSAGE